MLEERALAKANNYPDPIQPTLEDTANAYNATVRILLDKLKQDAKFLFVIASHNTDSALKASNYLKEIGLADNDHRVYFAQLQVTMMNSRTYNNRECVTIYQTPCTIGDTTPVNSFPLGL